MNLSDGGHFDNLGLYELVRRRCRYIIIGDGEQDGELTFGSLGGAIRKCRADFGVEIDIDPDPIRIDQRTQHGPLRGRHDHLSGDRIRTLRVSIGGRSGAADHATRRAAGCCTSSRA